MSEMRAARKAMNRDEAQRLLLTTTAPSVIQPEEADRLIDFVVDESVLFAEAFPMRPLTRWQRFRRWAMAPVDRLRYRLACIFYGDEIDR
ncbi:MAG: hypothetical protein OES13_00410 [Acidimicrobiia bacterium]|nr:hypothetical protein [Acidimicrobiia bacterium]